MYWKNLLITSGNKPSLYDFQSFTFTNAGKTGNTGPTLTQCRNAYKTTWANDPTLFSVIGGIQIWTVPQDGIYRITTMGAGSGGTSGYGARMIGNFSLMMGDKLHILVGQKGNGASSSGCGGGGTFVVKDGVTPLIIAGGGGGSHGGNHSYQHGTTSTTGNAGLTNGASNNNGGRNGGGGSKGPNIAPGAGGGFSGNGAGNGGGRSFRNGGQGGSTNGVAGFGGGGSQRGGGGGYSGGGAGGWGSGVRSGGGGGSYNIGTNQSNTTGANANHGNVQIVFLG